MNIRALFSLQKLLSSLRSCTLHQQVLTLHFHRGMSSPGEPIFHRRPALIPPNVHLSSEDERSILLRIGNLQLASPGTERSSSNCNASDDPCFPNRVSPRRPLVRIMDSAKHTTSEAGTKRKSSTTAEQYHEQNCNPEMIHGSESHQADHCKIAACYALSTTVPQSTLCYNKMTSADEGCLRYEDENVSPKNFRGLAYRDNMFKPT